MAANSIREQILLTVLEAVRPSALALGATLHRSPTVAITERANDRVTRMLIVRLVALARAVPPATPETEADRLLTAAHAALLAKRNLDDLALGIHEQECEWDIEDADAVAAAIPARYAITYRTLDTDLSTKG